MSELEDQLKHQIRQLEISNAELSAEVALAKAQWATASMIMAGLKELCEEYRLALGRRKDNSPTPPPPDA